VYIPLGIVIDERICSGAEYARAVKLLFKYMSNPELLEKKTDSLSSKKELSLL